MGNVSKHTVQKNGKRMKNILVLLCALLVFVSAVFLQPGSAEATVNVVNPWPASPSIRSNSNSGTVSGAVRVGAGSSRVMLVAVACEYSASTASPTFSATYGGQTVTLVTQSPTTSLFHIWLGVVNETKLQAAGANATLTVNNGTTANLAAMYVTTAVYAGVDQTTPTTGSNGASTGAATATSLTLGSYNVSGSTGIPGMSVTVAAWNGKQSDVTGYTEDSDYTGANFWLAGSFKQITANGTEAPSSAVQAPAIAGAMVGAGLNPFVKMSTIVTCGDCHSYGPVDGSARNVPDGAFTGSHNKHAGSAEYAFACTRCHYNHSTTTHSSGFKNVTGSYLPGTAYSRGKKIPVINNPVFGTCSNIYCHSSGRAAAMGTRQYTSSRWGGGKGNCLSCHGGRDSALGNPARSKGNFTLTTTHFQHLKYPAVNMNCQICHSQTAADAATLKQYSGILRHVNNVRDVTFNALPYGTYTAYKSTEVGSGGTTKKCSNISCHGGVTRSAWSNTSINTDNSCVHCHGVAGTLASVPNDKANRKYFAPGWNGKGTSTDQNKSSMDFRVGAHFKHLSSVYMKTRNCNECHMVPTNPFDGTHMQTQRYNSQTLTFAQSSSATWNGATGTYLPVFTGYTAGTAIKAASCSSVYCHGNRLKWNDQSGTDRKVQWAYSSLINYRTPNVSCGRCHGNPPTMGNTSSVHMGSAATTSCSGCHNGIVNNSGDITNKSLHINGSVNLSVNTSVTTSCNKCHGYPPQGPTVKYGRYSGLVKTPKTLILGASPANMGAHALHKTRQISCSACHFNNNNGGDHPNSAVQIFFRLSSSTDGLWNTASPMYKFGSYSSPAGATTPVSASTGGTTTVVNTAGRNSCNVYCHGAWVGSNKNNNPTWTGTVVCGDCHGTTALKTPKIGSHARHAGVGGNTTFANNTSGYTFACVKCHPTRLANDHIKGTVHVRFSTAVLGAGAAYTKTGATGSGTASVSSNKLAGDLTDGTCGNIYCHSSARGMGTPQYNTTNSWGTSTRSGCLACHGGRAGATGAYAPSTGGFRLSSSHGQHLKYPAANINCQVCHSKTTMTNAWKLKTYTGVIRHANGKRDVLFTDVAYGSITSYKSTAMGSGANTFTCANISCHGGTTRNAWSASTSNNDNTCVHCHGVAGTLPSETTMRRYAPGYAGTGTSTDQKTSSTDLRVGSHFKHLSSQYMKMIKCSECHAVPSNPFDGTHMQTARFNSQTLTFAGGTSARLIGGGTRSVMSAAAFTGYTVGTASRAATCSSVYCHGNRLKNGDTSGTFRAPYWNWSSMVNYSNPAEACGRCHGNPPATVTASHNGVTPTTGCSACHGGTVNAQGKIINKDLHINGLVNASGCNGCHGNPPTTSGNMTISPATTNAMNGAAVFYAHSTHSKGINKMDCNVCHNGYLSDAMGNKNINIGFAINNGNWAKWVGPTPVTFGRMSTNATLANSYLWNTTNSPGTTVSSVPANGSRNSCNVYCHGAWTGNSLPSAGRTDVRPSWSLAGQAACGKCHGATQAIPNQTNAHPKHVTLSGEGISCSKCHPNYIAGDHIKGVVHVRFSTSLTRIGASATYSRTGAQQGSGSAYVASGLAGRTDAPGTCSTIYCHSNGREVTPVNYRQFNTPTWATTGPDCLGCHGGRSSGTGNYVPSTDGFRLSTTHSQHLKYPAAQINCQSCHAHTNKTDAWTLNDYSSAQNHADGWKTVSFTDVKYGSYTTYKAPGKPGTGDSGAVSTTYNYKKCTNVSCHGGSTRSAWQERGALNNDNTCVHCHGAAGTPSTNLNMDRRYASPGYGYKVAGAPVQAGTSTDQVSAAPITATANDVKVGAHFAHVSSAYMRMIKCQECHYVPTNPMDPQHTEKPRYGSTSLTFQSGSTARKNGATNSALAVFTGYTAGVSSTKAATCSSVYCHGNRLKSGDTGGLKRKISWNEYTALSRKPSTFNCSRCHGNPPGSLTSVHNGKAATTSCTTCHYSTVDAAGNIINKQLHINGITEAPGASCLDCHAAAQGTRRAVSTEMGTGGRNSRHITNIALTKFHCIMCHAEGDYSSGSTTSLHNNGTIELRNVDSVANPGSAGTNYWSIPNTKVGTDWTNVDNFCFGCHDSVGSGSMAYNGTALVTSGLTTTQQQKPFNDNLTNAYDQIARTRVVDVSTQFTTTNYSHHAVKAAKYSAAGGLPFNAVAILHGGNVDDNSRMHCHDCHSFNGHGTVNEYMLQNSSGADALHAAGTYVCLKCHTATYSTNGHTAGNGSDFVNTAGSVGSVNRAGGNGSITGMSCSNCHNVGGTGWGGIHGGNNTYTDGGGATQTTYRFMPGTANNGYKPANWTAASAAMTCYTNPTAGWSACTSHTGGKAATVTRAGGARALSY